MTNVCIVKAMVFSVVMYGCMDPCIHVWISCMDKEAER